MLRLVWRMQVSRGRRRTWGALAAAALVALSMLPAAPAMADAPESIAIGPIRAGDTRVLYVGGDGVADRSPVVIRSYVAGLSGSAVNRQRWVLEPTSGTGIPSYAYRIKHVSSGKCLDKSQDNGAVNGAPIYLYTCSTAKNQIWWFPSSPDGDGLRLRNAVDNRCLDVKDSSTAEGSSLQVWSCASVATSAWNQRWMFRTGTMDCSGRNREWTDSRMCMSAGSAYYTGVMASWHHNPVGLAYKNPNTYLLSNSFRSRFALQPIDSQGSGSGLVEFGWEAERNNSNSTVQYNGYWIESGAAGEEYHSIPAEDAPGFPNGSASADTRQHNYMALGTGTSGEWDLYFDYNYVGTTANQVGGRTRTVDVGALARYIDAATLGAALEYRTQLMDGNGVWRRPFLVGTATTTPKTCGAPPVWDDYSGGAGGNNPPWCLKSGRYIQTNTNPVEVSSYNVVKPTNATASRRNPGIPEPLVGAGHVNGVNQAVLADCLNNAADECLQAVPGLKDCVDAKLRCNQVAPRGEGRTTQSQLLSAEGAKTQAASTLPFPQGAHPRIDDWQVQKATGATLGRNLPKDVPPNAPVLVVAGTALLESWTADAPPTSKRWTLYYHQTTGRLLYGHLY